MFLPRFGVSMFDSTSDPPKLVGQWMDDKAVTCGGEAEEGCKAGQHGEAAHRPGLPARLYTAAQLSRQTRLRCGVHKIKLLQTKLIAICRLYKT